MTEEGETGGDCWMVVGKEGLFNFRDSLEWMAIRGGWVSRAAS
jgi:hypothetical protein